MAVSAAHKRSSPRAQELTRRTRRTRRTRGGPANPRTGSQPIGSHVRPATRWSSAHRRSAPRARRTTARATTTVWRPESQEWGARSLKNGFQLERSGGVSVAGNGDRCRKWGRWPPIAELSTGGRRLLGRGWQPNDEWGIDAGGRSVGSCRVGRQCERMAHMRSARGNSRRQFLGGWMRNRRARRLHLFWGARRPARRPGGAVWGGEA